MRSAALKRTAARSGRAARPANPQTLTEQETEDVGLALMRLEEAIREIGGQFGLAPEDLNLDLGPLGKLV